MVFGVSGVSGASAEEDEQSLGGLRANEKYEWHLAFATAFANLRSAFVGDSKLVDMLELVNLAARLRSTRLRIFCIVD